MSQQHQQSESAPSTTFHIWEGEWLALRRSVTSARLFLTDAYHATYKLLNEDFNLITNTRYYLAIADRNLVHVSRHVSNATQGTSAQQQLFSNNDAAGAVQWLVPAAGISVVSCAVGLKSARRWGFTRGVRNGAGASVALVLALYPHEIKENCLTLAEKIL